MEEASSDALGGVPEGDAASPRRRTAVHPTQSVPRRLETRVCLQAGPLVGHAVRG